MIPEREQRVIAEQLASGLAGRVRIDYFTQRASKIVVPGRQDCRFCKEVGEALEDIAKLHPKLALTVHEFAETPDAAEKLGVKRVPCTVIRGQANRPLRYYGLPGGAQFPLLIETIVLASRRDVPLAREASLALKKLRGPVQASVFVTPVCRYSPVVASAAFRMALAHAQLKAEVVEVTEFPELVQRYGVRGTPTTVIDGRTVIRGAVDELRLAEAIVGSSLGEEQTMTALDAGPVTPFDPQAIEKQAAADAPNAPRIYVPGQ